MSPKRPTKGRRRFEAQSFEVVYEDNFLLVIEKRAGFLSVPTRNWNRQTKGIRTVIGEIKQYLSIKGGRDLGATPIHRLDRDTSGLLVVAKSSKIAQRIKEQFQQRKPEREYAAIVNGLVSPQSGTFKSHMATDEDLNEYSTGTEEHGKLAITHYEVVSTQQNTTLVRVKLETGRRNQIRVHFSEAGFPVLGDTRYLPEKARHALWPYPRLALHAAKFGFYHPLLKSKLYFESKLPEEFRAFLENKRL